MRTFTTSEDRKPLTDRQQKILDFIRSHTAQRGYPPTVREIGDEFGIKSPNGVMCNLKALERKGYIIRGTKLSRAILLVDGIPALKIPLLGRIPAGSPWTAEEQDDSIDLGLFARHRQFAVRVVGCSMIEAGILDGDVAIIRPVDEVHDGQIVAAMLDGDVTLKRFYRESATCVRLEPANSSMAPILAENVTVLGVMVGVIRDI